MVVELKLVHTVKSFVRIPCSCSSNIVKVEISNTTFDLFSYVRSMKKMQVSKCHFIIYMIRFVFIRLLKMNQHSRIYKACMDYFGASNFRNSSIYMGSFRKLNFANQTLYGHKKMIGNEM